VAERLGDVESFGSAGKKSVESGKLNMDAPKIQRTLNFFNETGDIMGKKLFFLTSRLPYPPSSGRKSSLYYYCKYLHELYGFQIVTACFLEEGDSVGNVEKPDFIEKVVVLGNPSFQTKVKNLLIHTVIGRHYPFQVSLYYDQAIQRHIRDLIRQEQPDLLMCDMIRTAEYLKEFHIPKILDMDDLLSLRYQRQLTSEFQDVNPFGAYFYGLPKLLQRVLSNDRLKKMIVGMETRLTRKYEIESAKQYDLVIFVAQKEADELNRTLGVPKALAVPLGVETRYFEQMSPVVKEAKSISFLGKLSYPQNEAAVFYFCQRILPLIIAQIPDVKFYIVGSSVTDKIKALASPNVIVVGRVDDIRPHISRTRVFVCPVLFGSGIKAKNLEAMAMKVPVVTTPVGAESIEAVNGRDWFICDGDERFAATVVEILNDDKLGEMIGLNGYRYVKDNFDWSVVNDRWNDVLEHESINLRGGRT
jgi:glycosyltransferase involved in cell wall biosynthesis